MTVTLLPGCRWLCRWRPERAANYYWQRAYPATRWVPLPASEVRDTNMPEPQYYVMGAHTGAVPGGIVSD